MTAVAHRRGVGSALLGALIAASEVEAYWTLQAQIMAASSPDDGPDATSAEDEFGSLIRRIRAHHGIGETAS